MALAKESITSVLQGTNKSDLKKVLPKLLDEIDYYKSKTRKYIDGKYVDFLHQLPETETYMEDCESLIGDGQLALASDETTGTRETLSMADIELQQYKNEVRKICLEMQTLKKILRVDALLEEIERCSADNETLGVMEFLSELEELVNDQDDTVFRSLSCFENIEERFEKEKSQMQKNLKDKFSQLVQMTEKQFQTNKLVCLKLTTNIEELKDVIVALQATDFKSQWISDFLLDNILVPIMTRPVSLESNQTPDSDYVELKLSFSVKPRTADDLKPKYQIVFRNLKTVLGALQEIQIFGVFGQYMQDRFMRTLIDQCLMDAVPTTMDDMKETTLTDDVLAMHEYLVDISFYDKEQLELVQFSQKIDALFRNRFSTGILNTAVSIMRKDLSDIVLMSPGGSEEEKSTTDSTATSTDSNLTTFPRCMVSKSIMELVTLMSKIIREIELLSTPTAAGDSEPARIQLLSIISVILDRYITEVPSYHKKLLTRIPHLTALFHNNCQYLSFWVGKRESILSMSPDAQLLVGLKRLGQDYLAEQVGSQRTQIMDIMKEFDLNDSLTELSQGVYRCVRQCLRQLDLLKNVWQSILPDGCYNANLGALLNDFIVEVMRKIMILEDIATPIANGLVDVISLIVERAPMVFADPLRTQNIVRSWSKLGQLKMILGASLLEITQHWAEGTGPLTLNFRADEIKHLIRALFQNTKRRADALNTIV